MLYGDPIFLIGMVTGIIVFFGVIIYGICKEKPEKLKDPFTYLTWAMYGLACGIGSMLAWPFVYLLAIGSGVAYIVAKIRVKRNDPRS